MFGKQEAGSPDDLPAGPTRLACRLAEWRGMPIVPADGDGQQSDPDFVEHQFGLHPTIEGMQGDIQFLRKAFPDFNLTIEEKVAVDDKVWVRMTARGTNLGGFMGPPNGKSFEIAVFDSAALQTERSSNIGDRLTVSPCWPN